MVQKNWRFIEGGGADNVGKTNTLRIEVGLRQNTLLGETAPPTSQFVRFYFQVHFAYFLNSFSLEKLNDFCCYLETTLINFVSKVIILQMTNYFSFK